ncbi:MAG TPA: hypothetical protein DDZ88_20125 [Verrucomicrobiales bacterium]|nr:hypothetical protein [Verrucomicrobiales bacterium]
MPTTLEQSQYGFDRNSRRTWQRRSLTDTQDQQYNYDTLIQVSAAARGSLNLNKTAISGRPASAESWDYDPTGNWRGYHAAANGTNTLDQHRVHDRGNRLTQIEDNPHNMILDRVGRMRQMAPDAEGDWDGTLELTWDAWSRITSVKNNGEVVGEYTYDGLNGRIMREVDGETLHSYYNDEWRPVEERKNAATTAAISYLWGNRHRDDLVRRDRALGGTTFNETRYVLMDYFNPAALTDETGEVKERYAFSAFGLRTILNPDFTVRSNSESAFEFAFQGQFLDGESSLINYGYRYYLPQLGRWACKDPIGEEGGVNLYGYAVNNAVNLVDHLGLDPIYWEPSIPNNTRLPNGRFGPKAPFGRRTPGVTPRIPTTPLVPTTMPPPTYIPKPNPARADPVSGPATVILYIEMSIASGLGAEMYNEGRKQCQENVAYNIFEVANLSGCCCCVIDTHIVFQAVTGAPMRIPGMPATGTIIQKSCSSIREESRKHGSFKPFYNPISGFSQMLNDYFNIPLPNPPEQSHKTYYVDWGCPK